MATKVAKGADKLKGLQESIEVGQDVADGVQATYDSLNDAASKTRAWVKAQGGADKIKGKWAVFGATYGVGSRTMQIIGYDEKSANILCTTGKASYSKYATTFERWATGAEDEEKKDDQSIMDKAMCGGDGLESLINSIRGAPAKTEAWVKQMGGPAAVEGLQAKFANSMGIGSYDATILAYDPKTKELQIRWTSDGNLAFKYVTTMK